MNDEVGWGGWFEPEGGGAGGCIFIGCGHPFVFWSSKRMKIQVKSPSKLYVKCCKLKVIHKKKVSINFTAFKCALSDSEIQMKSVVWLGSD